MFGFSIKRRRNLIETAKELITPKTDLSEIQKGRCPDCGSTQFFEGPAGGLCQNFECAGCGQRFNIMFGLGTGPFRVDRI